MKEYRTILIGLGLVFLVVIVVYYLYHLERQHQQALREAERQALDLEASALEARSSGELEVVLYFYGPGVIVPSPDLLVPEKRSIFQTEDAILTARQIIHETIKGPNEDGLPIFSEQAKLRQVYLLEDGTAVVDFSREATHQLGGVTAELCALYSITRSLTENIQEIKRVKFLVGGQERPSFAGHVSIREPFM
ncbi:MAG: GerMN domain-containing protein [Acidobacteriota bacterium]